jgi:hypothetical protein
MMSRPVARKNETFSGEIVEEYELHKIDCQKENCALWIKEQKFKDGDLPLAYGCIVVPAHCGLIQEKP